MLLAILLLVGDRSSFRLWVLYFMAVPFSELHTGFSKHGFFVS